MQTYTHYKDSGIDWIGPIPEHWEVNKLKFFSKIKSITNRTEEELLSVYLDKGVINFNEVDAKRTNVTSLDLSKYQLVEVGDFVLNNQQAWRGSVGVSKYKGIVSPAYIVLDLIGNFNLSYANYFFRDINMVSKYLMNSKGVGTIQRNLYWPSLKEVFIYSPPIHEQEAIANFLDDRTAKIDALVQTKEQQIEKLKELRQAKIHQAVTKGLDASASIKDSGIEWIGEIPEHWEVSKVKNYLKIPITDGPHTTPILLDEGIPFISAEAIKNGKIDFNKKRGNISEEDYKLFSQKYVPQRNDIYMIKSGATTGNIAMVETDDIFTIWSPLAVFRSNHRILPKFLYNILQSSYFKTSVELSWSFGTQQNIGMGVLSNLYITIPISLKEQEQIVAYLDEVTGKIDQAITQKQVQITKLKEYKQSLINDVVTGKVKVC